MTLNNISNYDSSRENLLFAGSFGENMTQELLFVTANGLIKKTPISEFITNTRTIAGTKLGDGDELVYVGYYNKKQVVLHSEKGSFLRFASEEINTARKNTLGQKAMALAERDLVKEVWQVTPGEDSVIETGSQTIDLKRIRLSSRGGRGIKLRLNLAL